MNLSTQSKNKKNDRLRIEFLTQLDLKKVDLFWPDGEEGPGGEP
jgi:hypothetical protein